MGIGLLILILGIGHPAYTNQGIPDIVTRKLGTEVRPVYTIPHIDPTIPTDTGIISKLIIFCQEIVRMYQSLHSTFIYFCILISRIFFRYPDYKPVPPPKSAPYKPVPPPKPKNSTNGQPEGNYMNNGYASSSSLHYHSSNVNKQQQNPTGFNGNSRYTLIAQVFFKFFIVIVLWFNEFF